LIQTLTCAFDFPHQVRISISSICFIRDLFPKDCFKNKQYGELTVTHTDAFLLTQWLESGVFAALEDEFLTSLVFAVYTKHPITELDLLIETYEFKISYPDGSGVAKVNDIPLISKDTVKSQAAKFIRSLTEFTSTLDILPEERWITLQLKVIPPTVLSTYQFLLSIHKIVIH
jgi:hypothetical protein